MLIHASPRLYYPYSDQPQCELMDLNCPELGLSLVGGVDLVARRPYPNKHFLVACRKVGQRAVDGILVETSGHVAAFAITTRWRIPHQGNVITHVVNYTVLDDDFDAVTDDMVLWGGFDKSSGGWGCRIPAHAMQWTPAASRPRMEATPTQRQGNFADQLSQSRPPIIEQRVEDFSVPTVERGRLLTMGGYRFWERLPSPVHAFLGQRTA